VGYRAEGGGGSTSSSTTSTISSPSTTTSSNGCAVPKSCTDAAADCATNAKKAHAQCIKPCSGSSICKDGCDAKQQSDLQSCADKCVTCAPSTCDAGAPACDKAAGL
jgi:hypothetical protein